MQWVKAQGCVFHVGKSRHVNFLFQTLLCIMSPFKQTANVTQHFFFPWLIFLILPTVCLINLASLLCLSLCPSLHLCQFVCCFSHGSLPLFPSLPFVFWCHRVFGLHLWTSYSLPHPTGFYFYRCFFFSLLNLWSASTGFVVSLHLGLPSCPRPTLTLSDTGKTSE